MRKVLLVGVLATAAATTAAGVTMASGSQDNAVWLVQRHTGNAYAAKCRGLTVPTTVDQTSVQSPANAGKPRCRWATATGSTGSTCSPGGPSRSVLPSEPAGRRCRAAVEPGLTDIGGAARQDHAACRP